MKIKPSLMFALDTNDTERGHILYNPVWQNMNQAMVLTPVCDA